MNHTAMRVFLHVLNNGSFSETSRQLHMSQPAVSSIINSLEDELGKKLLIRTSGQRSPIQPTEAGQVFSRFCKNALANYEQLKNDLVRHDTTTPFTLAANPSAHAYLMPKLFRVFSKEFPTAVYQYQTHTTQDEAQRLLDSKTDLIIFAAPIHAPNIESKRFLYDPLQFICPPSMGLKDTIRLKDFKKLPLIIRNPNTHSMKLLNAEFQRLGFSFEDLNIVLEVRGAVDVAQSVSLDMGCGFVPRSLLPTKSIQQNVVPVTVEKLNAKRFVQIARLKDTPLSSGAQLFWDFVFTTSWRDSIFSYDTTQYIDRPHL